MKPKLVCVEWHDASFNEKEWMTRETEHALVHLLTVGFLLREDRDVIHLAADYSPADEQFRGVTSIPRGMIRRKTVVRMK